MDAQAPRRSPRRWPFGVLVLGLCLWGLHVADDSTRNAPRVQPAAPPPMAVAPAMRPALSALTHTAAHRPATQPSPAAVAAATPLRAAAAQAEVCGFGPVTLEADETQGPQRLPPAVRERAFDEIEAHMLASADPQVQAAALLIGARARGDERSRIDRLARLAVVSQDPVVYAIALEACKAWPAGDAATCALLSRAQWVRLDPDNAQAWLELAAQSRQQHELDAEAEAMRRAARGHRSDAHAGLLPALVERALGVQTPLLQRTLALSASWRIEAAWARSHTSQAHAYCTADIDADPGRRETCDAIAETLAHRGTGVAELGVGIAIGAKLGWPAQRLQALQQEHDAINEAAGVSLGGRDLSCESIDRMQAWTREWGPGGELQAMRRLLARSGRSVEDWSAQYRRNFMLAEATAETASLSVAGDAALPESSSRTR